MVEPNIRPGDELSVMQVTPDPKPPESETPACVSAEDRLLAVNMHLRVKNLALEIQMLEHTINTKMSERKQLDDQIRALQAALTERYGIDFTKQMIRETDGAIVPLNLQQLMVR